MNLTIIEFMESQLSSLKKDSEEYKSLSAAIEKTKSEFSDLQKKSDEKEVALKASSEANKKLTEQFGDLASKVVALESQVQVSSAELALQKERARHAEVKQFCTDLVTKGMPKPVVDAVQEILFADRDNKVVMTFGEGDKKEGLTVRHIVSKILNSIPADSKVPLGEVSNFNTGSNNGELSNKEKTTSQQFNEQNAAVIDSVNKKVFNSYKRTKKTSALNIPAADPIGSKN